MEKEDFKSANVTNRCRKPETIIGAEKVNDFAVIVENIDCVEIESMDLKESWRSKLLIQRMIIKERIGIDGEWIDRIEELGFGFAAIEEKTIWNNRDWLKFFGDILHLPIEE
jgi:hypothetical protein